jgi:hypothetical protein
MIRLVKTNGFAFFLDTVVFGQKYGSMFGICEQRPVKVRCYPNNDQIDASQRMQRCANSGHAAFCRRFLIFRLTR